MTATATIVVTRSSVRLFWPSQTLGGQQKEN